MVTPGVTATPCAFTGTLVAPRMLVPVSQFHSGIKAPPDSILCSPGHRFICIIGVAVLDELLLVNPLAQMGDRRREGDDEGTSETREQHACSRYRDQVN
jgi:hypothetical protein